MAYTLPVTPAQLNRLGIDRSMAYTLGDCLTLGVEGCLKPRELRFADILMYMYIVHVHVYVGVVFVITHDILLSTLTASVHLPRIGHSTPNFNWYGTERLIRKHLASAGIPTYMYPSRNIIFTIPCV